MKYFKKLLGDRIYLSPRSIEDVEKFTEWMNDFEVTDYTGRSGVVMSLEGERKYLQENSNPEATFSIVTLEEDKLIYRKIYAEVPPHVEYGLTDIGKKIVPLLEAMYKYGIEYSYHN